MGNCTSQTGSASNPKRKTPLKQDTIFTGDSVPPASQGITKNNQQLIFDLRLSNIKLKNVPYATVGVDVRVENIVEVKLDNKKTVLKTAKWKIDESICFKILEENLRQTFVSFMVKDTQHKVAEVRLNLYLIAKGPFHQDFPLHFANNTQGRISVDIRISQLIEISVTTLGASVTLHKTRPGQQYHYTIRTISLTCKDNQSEPSYVASQAPSSYESHQKQKGVYFGTTTSNISQVDQKLSWSGEVALSKHQEKLPNLKSSVMSSQIMNSCLQFLLWKNDLNNQQTGLFFCGQCYISFGKIQQISTSQKIRNEENEKAEMFEGLVVQKLWCHGKYIGDVELLLSLVIPKHFRQTMVFVRTENGVETCSPVFHLEGVDSKLECIEIKELRQYKSMIDRSLERINLAANQPEIQKECQNSIHKGLAFVLPLLGKTIKESILIYAYNSEVEMLQAQMLLLQIGYRLTEKAQESLEMEELGWRCLLAVMKRGELTLRYVGFKEKEKQLIALRCESAYLKEKIEFALKFQGFIYRILKLVILSLNKKALREHERNFVEVFCAYSFFRIPQFKERVLKIIHKPNDPQIGQWRGTEFPLEESQIARNIHSFHKDQDTFGLLFDWSNNFYNVLAADERYQNHCHELEEILKGSPWEHRFQKRGIAFFRFISAWVRYVGTAAVISQNVKWQNLPGYAPLIRAFFCEMKIRNIIEYPDSMCETMNELLANEKLLNVLILLILNKTSLYDSQTALKSIQLINGFFRQLHKRNKAIPVTFNYTFFFNALKEMVACDHSFIAAQTLVLYYEHYNSFNPNFRHEFDMYLLSKVFFKLFLNWSMNVRVVLHHLMIFRMYLQSSLKTSNKEQYAQSEELKKRYQLLLNIVENAFVKKESDENKKFAYNFEKDLYKTMRKKLNDRRKIVNSDQASRAAQKIDMSEFTLKELIEKKVTRSKSEIVQPQVNYQKPKKVEKDLARLNRLQSSNFEPPMLKEAPKLRNVAASLAEKEIPQLKQEQLYYLRLSIGQFRNIEDNYLKFFAENTENDDVPEVKIKIPLDEDEERIGTGEQW